MIFLVFLLVLAVIASEKKEDKALFHNINRLGIVSFLVFFGCRGYIWHDWTVYAHLFGNISWSDLLSYNYFKHTEPLWLVYELVCKTIVDNYYFLAFVSSLINTILLVRFFSRYSISVLFALATYVAFSGFEISINLMRNSMAMFIVLNALPYIEEKEILEISVDVWYCYGYTLVLHHLYTSVFHSEQTCQQVGVLCSRTYRQCRAFLKHSIYIETG